MQAVGSVTLVLTFWRNAQSRSNRENIIQAGLLKSNFGPIKQFGETHSRSFEFRMYILEV